MKIVLSKSELANAASRLSGATIDRALSQIGLKVTDKELELAANDRIIAIYTKVSGNTSETGVEFVPARLFLDVVKELPNGPVELSSDSANLSIVAGENKQFSMKIPIIEDMTWKDAPKIAGNNEASFKSQDLSYLIDQVQYCLVQDSPRNYGAVGYLHKVDDNTLRLVGTDGFRLSYCNLEGEIPDNFLASGISISKRGLQEINRMCSEGFEKVHISVSDDETTLCAGVSDYTIFLRLSAIKYPNYQAVLPKNANEETKVSRNGFQHVAKRVLLAADKSNVLRLEFNRDRLTLSSRTTGKTESREEINLDNNSEELDCNLSVNGKFLKEVFSVTASDEVVLGFKDEKAPMVITPSSEPSRCNSIHVLMPIQENR